MIGCLVRLRCISRPIESWTRHLNNYLRSSLVNHFLKHEKDRRSSKRNLRWQLNGARARLAAMHPCSDTSCSPYCCLLLLRSVRGLLAAPLVCSVTAGQCVTVSLLAVASVEQRNASRRPDEGEIGTLTPLRPAPSVLTFWPIVKVLILLFRAH